MSQQSDIETFASVDGDKPAGGRVLPGIGFMAGIAIIVTASAAGLLDLLPGGSLTLGLAGLGGAVLACISVFRRTEARPVADLPAPVVTKAVEEAEIEAIKAPEEAEVVEVMSVEPLLDRLLDIAPMGVVITGRDGRVRQANSAAWHMAATDVFRETAELRELFDAADAEQADTLLAQAIAAGPGGVSADLKLGAGSDRVAQVHGGMLNADSDDPQMAFFLVDATEQRSLEAQFSQGQRMQAVGQLAGGVAHDFNNLLTAMIGFADLLLMRHPPGDPSYTDIVHIKQNANRAAALVRQLLAFSRRQTLRPKILNLTDVLTDLSDLLRRLIGEHLNIRIVHERDLGLVKADQGQIEQVVTNLVVNARDALDSGGSVSITTNNVRIDKSKAVVGNEKVPAGDYVEIAVSDTGHGISEENLAKIFEPFFTTKPIGQGTGLGLATVYGIIRQTGGYVEVESVVGEGTTFRVLLPRVEDDAARNSRQARRDAVDLTGSGTVLLVEDEDAVRLFAARALRNKGYNLIEAESGDAALDIIQKRADEIDLMISDVVMPNMDGPTLIRRARELRPDIRAVFISGYAEEAFRRSLGDDLGDVDLLPKPFSLKQLAAKVKEQLEA